MKIKIPEIAKFRATANGLPTTLIKIPGKCGWDIIDIIANYNCMNVISFVKLCDPSVYADHIIIDNCVL